MKCPKCHYISFDSGSRCRNCGYEFSLAEDASATDLPIHGASQPIGPLTDLPLAAPEPGGDARHHDPPPHPSGANGSKQVSPATDLPLFTAGKDDAPLVSAPAVPRPPLAVRRGPPAAPKPRQRSPERDAEPRLDLDEPYVSRRARPEAAPDAEPAPGEQHSTAGDPAPALSRILAAIIDVVIVGAIDITVVYLTLRLAQLQLDDILVLPKIPLIAFLMLLNGGYFVLFTAAGGQTIGKMAAGIRVVPHGSDDGAGRIAFSTAVVRAAAYAASLLPAGLGFVPILFSHDGRTLHDRLSDTRVVKA